MTVRGVVDDVFRPFRSLAFRGRMYRRALAVIIALGTYGVLSKNTAGLAVALLTAFSSTGMAVLNTPTTDTPEPEEWVAPARGDV